jgi:hypothetical protein
MVKRAYVDRGGSQKVLVLNYDKSISYRLIGE